MKQSFGVFWKEDTKKLNQDEFIDEVTRLRLFQVFLSHEVHELTNQFRHQKVKRRRYYCNYDGLNDVFQEGKDQIFKQMIVLFGRIKPLDPSEKLETRFTEVVLYVNNGLLGSLPRRTRYMCTKQCRWR